MSKREAFLLRTDPKVLAALRRWSEDELRSMNAQLDYILRAALRKAGRMERPGGENRQPESNKTDREVL